jgi:hypothetical protein
MTCLKRKNADGWNECRPCAALWFGADHRCYGIPPKHPLPYAPRFTISWRLVLVSLAMWALLGYLAWRFF